MTLGHEGETRHRLAAFGSAVRAFLPRGDDGPGLCEEWFGLAGQVAECRVPTVSSPALPEVMRPVVTQVAALAEAAEIAQPVVGRFVIEMRGGEHHPSGADPQNFDQVGPAAR